MIGGIVSICLCVIVVCFTTIVAFVSLAALAFMAKTAWEIWTL